MSWWEDEDNLEEFETPDCFGDMEESQCECCLLIGRVGETVMKLGIYHEEAGGCVNYWLDRIYARYGMHGVMDAMMKLGMRFIQAHVDAVNDFKANMN